MKQLPRTLLLVFFLSLASFAAAADGVPSLDLSADEQAWLAKHPVIRVAFNAQWAPVEFADATGRHSGISSAYISRLEKLIGVPFERIPIRSEGEVMALVETKAVDMMPILSNTTKRQEIFNFTEPYLSMTIAIFSAEDVAYVGGPKSLKGKKVAVVGDHVIHDWLKRDYPEIMLAEAFNVRDALRMLSCGDVFAYIGAIIPASYYIGESGLTQIKMQGETPYRYQLGMAVRKDLTILAGIIQKGLDAISETERDKIYNEWISKPIQQPFDYTLLWQILAVVGIIFLVILYWNRLLRLEIVQRKKIEQQLRRVTRAVEQCHITIMITNREGMIEYVNPAFTLSSGYRPEEVLGKSIEILRPEECDEELYRNIMHTLETKGLWRGEVENRRKDGSPYWMFAAISSVKDEDGGKVTHYVAVKQDVTKRKMAAMYLLRHPLPGS